MKHNLQTLPPVVWQAVILEQESAPYTLGIFLSEQAVFGSPRRMSPWFEPELLGAILDVGRTVQGGVVLSKKYVDVGVKSEAEECAAC